MSLLTCPRLGLPIFPNKLNTAQLSDQRIVIYGAGSAGMGIARQLRDAIKLSVDGMSDDEAGKCFYLIDKIGLLKKSKRKEIHEEIEDSLIRDEEEWGDGDTSLEDVVKKVRPTVLIGTSTQKGAFTEDVVSPSLQLEASRNSAICRRNIGRSSGEGPMRTMS